jgi:hypothetical protein
MGEERADARSVADDEALCDAADETAKKEEDAAADG